MIIPFTYGYGVNAPLLAARRKVVEKMVEAKGLIPGTGKFMTVVHRHMSKVRYRRECRFDAEIPPDVLALARQGKWPPEPRSKSQQKKRKR